jgi:hypothetical protein
MALFVRQENGADSSFGALCLDFEKQKEGGRSFSMFIFSREAFGGMLNEKGQDLC